MASAQPFLQGSPVSIELPGDFLTRMEAIVPREAWSSFLDSFSSRPRPAFRINTLKIETAAVHDRLGAAKIAFEVPSWYPDALMLSVIPADCPVLDEMQSRGEIYRQGLASMLVPLAMKLSPPERILDLCAAPGGKTSQIVALSANRSSVVACDAVRNRIYKLKSVLTLLGVNGVEVKCLDGRRLRSSEMFDKILVDAPCSCEGRFLTGNARSWGYWSTRKIKEMARKQKGLLLNAWRLLRPGGVMVYSTCTFAPEENEAVVDWLIRKTDDHLRVETLTIAGRNPETVMDTMPPLTSWNGREFSSAVSGCLRILPDRDTEGFFIARFRKV